MLYSFQVERLILPRPLREVQLLLIRENIKLDGIDLKAEAR